MTNATLRMRRTALFFVVAGLGFWAVAEPVATTLYWRGTSSESASDAANWVDSVGNPADDSPQTGDAVVLDGNSGSGRMIWDISDVKPASWTQTSDYKGTAVLMVGTRRATAGTPAADGVNRELCVVGKVEIAGGILTCGTNTHVSAGEGLTTDEGDYRLWLTAGGDVSIGANATVDVSRCGFYYGRGTGANSSHGGLSSGAAYSKCYGSIFEPDEIGSGGSDNYSSLGAGAGKIKSGGTLTINGVIDATPSFYTKKGEQSGFYQAPGGSIWLTAKSMAGTGRISANGGPSKSQVHGTGGRIALYLTDAASTFDGLAWTVECHGSYVNGAPGNYPAYQPAGTVYRELATDSPRHGELIVHGGDAAAPERTDSGTGTFYSTPLKSDDATEFNFRRIELKGAAILSVHAGTTLDLTGTEISGSTGKYEDALALAGGTLRLPGNAYSFTNLQLWSMATSRVEFTSANGLGTLTLAKGGRFDSPLGIPGSLVLSAGTISHSTQPGAAPKFWTEISTTNDLTIGASATISADGRGLRGETAPGYGGGNTIGGSYGGLGYGATRRNCYGDPRNPQEWGSAGITGGCNGGGRIRLNVGGALDVSGTVSANGALNWWGPAGSGGSVYISTASLTGAGRIRAGGGTTSAYAKNNPYSGGGSSTGAGGGRIAVILNQAGATFADYTGTMEVPGSASDSASKRRGANGTIYLREPGQALDEGTLVIDAYSTLCAPGDGLGAGIHTGQNGITVGRVVFRNGGALQIAPDCLLNVKESFTNDNTGTLRAEIGGAEETPGTVAFVGAAASEISGTNTFGRLLCEAPGKTLRFGGAGSLCTIAEGGSLEISGESSSYVNLRGPSEGVAWYLAMVGSPLLTYSDVAYSDASAGAKVSVSAKDNRDSGHNVNWNFFASIVPGETNSWTGAAGDGAWANAANWSRQRAPVETDAIDIPAGENPYPTLAGSVSVGRLMIAAGASLNLGEQNLTVTNGVACAGTLVCEGAEVLSFAGDVTIKHITAANSTLNLIGTTARTVDLGEQAYKRIVVGTEGSPSLTMNNSFSADCLTCSCSAPFTLAFAASRTVTIGEMSMYGVVGGVAALTLGSNATGVEWYLNVAGKASGTGLIVRDSKVTSSVQAFAYNPSTCGDNVSGWVFGVSETTWQGGASGAWGTAANWSGGAVPGADSCVHFTSDATVTLDVNDATAKILDVADGTLTLKGEKTLTVKTMLEVLNGGTLNQAMTNEAEIVVEGNAFVRAGGTWTHPENQVGTTPTGRDLGYGIRATVNGNLVVENGGAVSAFGKGYWRTFGPAYGVYNFAASHGARKCADERSRPCYGSMFCPTELGSGGCESYASWGGGRIRLAVGGTLSVAGEITAKGETGSHFNSAGGSIWITAGALTGAGAIRADGSEASAYDGGMGGRIALYLTGTGDFGDFTGTITAYGGYTKNTVVPSAATCGTVYLQRGSEHGTVRLRNCGSLPEQVQTGGVDVPVTNRCPDAVKSYRNTTFDLAQGGVLYVTRDVTIGELELASPCRVNLNGHTLTINSWIHKQGRGWPTGWSSGAKTQLVFPGTNSVGQVGKIVWRPRPLAVIVR